MLLWIESRDSTTIALLTLALCYLVALLIYLAATALSRLALAAHLKATTPGMLTPLSVIAALLIAFVASHVWSNLDRANGYVAQEASFVRETILLADAFPADVRSAVRGAAKDYLRFVETEDWPAMAESRASLQQLPRGLPAAMMAILAFMPANPGQQLAQQRAIVAIDGALEARRGRILLSEGTVSPLQWSVILVLGILVLVTIAMVHIDRRLTIGVNLFLFATAMAACLMLLLINDRPLSAGGYTLDFRVFQEVEID
jgi:hypothetical protein